MNFALMRDRPHSRYQNKSWPASRSILLALPNHRHSPKSFIHWFLIMPELKSTGFHSRTLKLSILPRCCHRRFKYLAERNPKMLESTFLVFFNHNWKVFLMLIWADAVNWRGNDSRPPPINFHTCKHLDGKCFPFFTCIVTRLNFPPVNHK